MKDLFYLVSPPQVDASRWTPYLNQDVYLQGYFHYIRKAQSKNIPISDSNLKRLRFFALAGWCQSISGRKLNHVAECGCFLGHSTYMLSHILKASGFENTFHVFDSFEGLSDFTSEDLAPITSDISADELRRLSPQNKPHKKRPFAASLDVFEDLLSDFSFVKPYKGWIPSRFNEVENLTFSFVNLDLDIYQPTLDALSFFYPRVESGGIIWFDDYGLNTWPGCTKAVDEFRAELSQRDLVMKNPYGGLVIIKA